MVQNCLISSKSVDTLHSFQKVECYRFHGNFTFSSKQTACPDPESFVKGDPNLITLCFCFLLLLFFFFFFFFFLFLFLFLFLMRG